MSDATGLATSAEAAAGKNPVAHVGKIYNVMAQVLAEDIQKRVQGVRGVTVSITSQIGKPISAPHIVAGLGPRVNQNRIVVAGVDFAHHSTRLRLSPGPIR